MNKENAKDYLPLVQALADRKVIQFKGCDDGKWMDVDCIHSSSYSPSRYRIKPEPREIWVAFQFCGAYDSHKFYKSKDAAYRDGHKDSGLIKFLEVIE